MNNNQQNARITDYGGQPFIVNINQFAKMNNNFRTALWTGDCLQVTLMSIPVGEDIGIELHPDTDQLIKIEDGCARIMTGKSKNALNYQKNASAGYAVIIPAGTWHNVVNTGQKPLKVFSVYAPPHHPFGTVQKTKCDAEKEHH
ncbi:cupin domain-containing protein [Eubacterium sp.]|uniref:cupin domain-containing protein n=1 Tax=Eubacterium sp. TaxID=142586 RepID=UPI003EFCF8AE